MAQVLDMLQSLYINKQKKHNDGIQYKQTIIAKSKTRKMSFNN